MKALRAREVQEALGISHPTLVKLVRSGQLSAIRVGSQWRITEHELCRFLGVREEEKKGPCTDHLQEG